MIETIVGTVWKLGDDINTDLIAPGKWSGGPLDILKDHCLETVKPGFGELPPGTIIVAGKNFGCGSHRASATSIMQHIGISAIIADSVSRLYFRNCIAVGIPVFSIPGISSFVLENETLEISATAEQTIVRNMDKATEIRSAPMPELVLNILEKGGMYELMK